MTKSPVGRSGPTEPTPMLFKTFQRTLRGQPEVDISLPPESHERQYLQPLAPVIDSPIALHRTGRYIVVTICLVVAPLQEYESIKNHHFQVETKNMKQSTTYPRQILKDFPFPEVLNKFSVGGFIDWALDVLAIWGLQQPQETYGCVNVITSYTPMGG